MNRNCTFIQGTPVSAWLTRLFFEQALLWLWKIMCTCNRFYWQVQYIWSACAPCAPCLNYLQISMDLRVLSCAAITSSSSGNVMVRLQAVASVDYRGSTQVVWATSLSVTPLSVLLDDQFEINLSSCEESGRSTICGNFAKYARRDWRKLRKTQSVCMKCSRVSECTPHI
jgi:hypothetical protein